MSLAVVVLLGIGGLLAAAAGILVVGSLRRKRAALGAFADQRGWDYQSTGPDTILPLMERVVDNEQSPHSPMLLDYFAGPTAVGPFRLNRIRLPRTPQHRSVREATILHVRTPLSSPGIHVRPNPRFQTTAPPAEVLGADDRFSRLYQASGEDAEFIHRALDPDTRNLIAAPRRTIRLDWQGRDLVIAFPFAARTPRAVEALVTWSTALASRLNEAHVMDRRRATPGSVGPSDTPYPPGERETFDPGPRVRPDRAA